MSRRTKTRRTKRRARKAGEALNPLPVAPDTPVDWDRLQQRYRSMKGRAVTLSYVLAGPLVEARNPLELAVNTAIALAQTAKGQPTN